MKASVPPQLFTLFSDSGQAVILHFIGRCAVPESQMVYPSQPNPVSDLHLLFTLAGVLFLAGAVSQTIFQYSMAQFGFRFHWSV